VAVRVGGRDDIGDEVVSQERFEFIRVEVLQNGFLVHRVCGWRAAEKQ